MDFERNYPVKILSNQLNIRNFSTFKDLFLMNPFFLTGLIDAEGSFNISIVINKTRTLG
jgi:hypothetical protein